MRQSAEVDADASTSSNIKWKIKTDDSSYFNWHVNPFIVIIPSYWSGAFFAGLRFESSANKYVKWDKIIVPGGKAENLRSVKWSIPIGITVSF